MGYRQGTFSTERLRVELVRIARTRFQDLPFFRQTRQRRFASREEAVAEVAEALRPHRAGVALRMVTPLPPEPPAEPKTIHLTLHTYSTLVKSRDQLEELASKHGQVYHRYLLVQRNEEYILRVCNLAADPDGMLLEGEDFVASGHLLYGNNSSPTIAFDFPALATSFSGNSLKKIFQQILGFQNPNQVQKLQVLPSAPITISRPGLN